MKVLLVPLMGPKTHWASTISPDTESIRNTELLTWKHCLTFNSMFEGTKLLCQELDDAVMLLS
jgi:hypothetical protein